MSSNPPGAPEPVARSNRPGIRFDRMEWAGGFGDLGTLLEVFPPAVLGVIVFVAGAQLAMDVRSRGEDRREFLAMVVTAALAIWNVGIAFVAGSAVLFVARHIRSKP